MPDFYAEYKAKLEGNVKLDLEKIIQVEKKKPLPEIPVTLVYHSLRDVFHLLSLCTFPV